MREIEKEGRAEMNNEETVKLISSVDWSLL
jgi:hypothetical protein